MQIIIKCEKCNSEDVLTYKASMSSVPVKWSACNKCGYEWKHIPTPTLVGKVIEIIEKGYRNENNQRL